MFVSTILAPIERVKLIIQCQDEMLLSNRIIQPYKNPMDCFYKLLKENEGLDRSVLFETPQKMRGYTLFRGNSANILQTLIPSISRLGIITGAIHKISNIASDSSPLFVIASVLTISGSAALFNATLIYPLEFARTRLANDIFIGTLGKRQYDGLRHVFVDTIKCDGIRGLYRGFWINTGGTCLQMALMFGFMAPLVDNNTFLLSCYAYTITLLSMLTAYPLDTVSRRMMMRSGEIVKYKNSLDCMKQILKNEGYKSFYKGGAVNIIKAVSGIAIGLMMPSLVKYGSVYNWRHDDDNFKSMHR